MQRKYKLLVLLLIPPILSGCASLITPGGGGLDHTPSDTSIPRDVSGRYIVVFEEGIPPEAESTIAALGGEIVQRFSEIGVLVVVSNRPDFGKELAGMKGVEAVGHDEIWSLGPIEAKPLDTEPLGSPSLDLLYDLYQWDIKRVGGVPETWDIEKGAGAVVAVLDTGVNSAHPDIGPNYLYGKSYVDITAPLPPGWSVPPLEDGAPEDYLFHGSHVAGAVAAVIGSGPGLPSGYGEGVIGVAPEAKIANYKVLMLVQVDPDLTPGTGDEYYTGIGFTSWIISAIMDATDDGVDVINMSLGGTDLFTDPEDLASFVAYSRATQYAWENGALVVAAAGNDAWDPANNPWKSSPSMTPAALAVVSTGPDDELAFYSNYGAFNADFTAPGGSIPDVTYPYFWYDWYCLSTSSLASIYQLFVPHYYIFAIGTSMAAPKVSGVAALIYSQNPGITPTEVVRILEATAEDLGAPGYDLTFGWGMVNAFEAVSR